jgi:UDP-glucose 4-epimerase
MPVNAMGMSKALMEKIAQASARAHRSGTTVSTVRYGNVLYSRGSVVPLFVKQIWAGEALTVTEPRMTRFLMPLTQAVDLVEFAFFNAQPGDTFIRRAAATTIGDLAEAIRGLFGVDAPVRIIGIRHGEKLYETLATVEELGRAEDLGDYYRVPMDSRDLNYADYFEIGEVERRDLVEYNSHTAEQLDIGATQELLTTLPEVRSELDRWGTR